MSGAVPGGTALVDDDRGCGRRSGRRVRHLVIHGSLGAAADPFLAAFVELLLPERDALLELVDDVTAR
jgi:hypothetical protein